MTQTKFWLKIFGVNPGAHDPLMEKLSDAAEHLPNGNKILDRVFDNGSSVLTLFFTREYDRDAIVKRLVNLGDEFILKCPLRVGKEEWSIPHEPEALMVQSLKGITP